MNPLWARLQDRTLLNKWRALARKGKMMRLECGNFRVAEVTPPKGFDPRHLPYILAFGRAQGLRYIPTPDGDLYLAYREGRWFVAVPSEGRV